MRPIHSLVALVGLTVLLPRSAVSSDPICWGIESFSSTYAPDGLHLHFSLGAGGGGWTLYHDYGSYCWSTDVAFIYVFRRQVQGLCNNLGLVTDDPLAWVIQPGAPNVVADIIDTNVEPNVAYQYLVRAADSYGQWIQEFPESVIGYASTGVALICRGTLTEDFDFAARYVASCDQACFEGYNGQAVFVISTTPDAEPYFSTQTTLAVYGEFDGLMIDPCNLCSHLIPAVRISSVAEAPCVSAVEPATWGAVKAMYK